MSCYSCVICGHPQWQRSYCSIVCSSGCYYKGLSETKPSLNLWHGSLLGIRRHRGFRITADALLCSSLCYRGAQLSETGQNPLRIARTLGALVNSASCFQSNATSLHACMMIDVRANAKMGRAAHLHYRAISKARKSYQETGFSVRCLQ
jgi:hypothetical protein